MQKNEEYIVRIDDVGNNAEGIAHLDSWTIFIPFTLPDELVEIKILRVDRGIAYAKLINIIEKSEYRTESRCPYYTKCGGCNLQHCAYEYQLKLKRQIVLNTLKKFINIKVAIKDCIGSCNQWNYRNKIQLPASSGRLGMFATNSHRLIPIESCDISNESSNKLIEIVNKFIANCGITTFDEETGKGLLRHIIARQVEDYICIVAVINGDSLPHYQELTNSFEKVFDNYSLFLNINKSKTNVILGNKYVLLHGESERNIISNGLKYSISPSSFFQINDCVRDNLYANVIANTKGSKYLIDAYSGAGLLSAMLSRDVEKVYGIEIIKSATDNANQLCKDNQITNVENINGDCTVEIPKILKQIEPQSTTVVVDPPRKGCSQQFIETINNSEVSKIIYISCNPASLGRDLALLSNYTPINIQPFDMFPQTKHIETLVVLGKKGK